MNAAGNTSLGSRAPSWAARIGCGLQAIPAALAGGFAVLFLFSNTYGGFALETPFGLLQCREPWQLLCESLLFWAIWSGVAWWRCRASGAASAAPHELPAPLGGGGSRAVPVLLALLTGSLWLRALYRSYAHVLLAHAPHPSVPFWECHLLFAAALIGALLLWSRLRRSDGALAAAFGATLFALSPTAFYVSRSMAAGYAVLALALLAAAARPERVGSEVCAPLNFRASSRRWVPLQLGLGLLAALALIGLLHANGLGWAGARVWTHFMERCLPGLSGILAAAAVAGALIWRSAPGNFMRWALGLSSLGIALAGMRESVGDLGALLLLPLAVLLAMRGVGLLWRRSLLGRTVLGRNILVVLLIGILLGITRNGTNRDINRPAYDTPAETAGQKR